MICFVAKMDILSANDLFVLVENHLWCPSLHLLLVTLLPIGVPRGCENANACTSESACLDRWGNHTLTVDGTAKLQFLPNWPLLVHKRDKSNVDVGRILKCSFIAIPLLSA